jgi:hypothetical protein
MLFPNFRLPSCSIFETTEWILIKFDTENYAENSQKQLVKEEYWYMIKKISLWSTTYAWTILLTYLLVLFVPTGTQGLNFTIVEVSIAVKSFTETGLLALCFNPQPRGVPVLVAFYDMHGLQWDYSFFPVTTQGNHSSAWWIFIDISQSIRTMSAINEWNKAKDI